MVSSSSTSKVAISSASNALSKNIAKKGNSDSNLKLNETRNNYSSVSSPTPQTPSKTNLDTFIAKDRARDLKSKSRPLPPPSEASDVAIAGHLLSKCNLDPPIRTRTISEKENTVNANFPILQSEQNTNKDITNTTTTTTKEGKEESRRKRRSLKRRERKERHSMPLVGSMVKVKLKKGKKLSLPPTSPASKLREYPNPKPRKKRKNPPLASVLDQELDEEDDESDEDVHVQVCS